MRANTLLKQDDYIQNNTPQESWETVRSRIARQAEEAANLDGNQNSPDFEDFCSRYGIKSFA